MRTSLISALGAGLLVAPIFAGSLWLQADDPQSHPEAMAKKAVVTARIGACVEPEKTTVTATATGIVEGKRQTVALHVIRLSDPNTFAITRDWPQTGTWVVSMIATNPNYRDYATGVVIPVNTGTAVTASAKSYSHAPTADEIDAALKKANL
jgi:hypothetical protein